MTQENPHPTPNILARFGPNVPRPPGQPRLPRPPAPTLHERSGQPVSADRRGEQLILVKLWTFVEQLRLDKIAPHRAKEMKTSLIREVLELPREARNKLDIQVIGVGFVEGDELVVTPDEPITAKIEVQFPDQHDRTVTRVIDQYDGVLFTPLYSQERKKRVNEVISGTRNEAPHEYAARLARGIRVLADEESKRRQTGIGPSIADLHNRKNILVDKFITAGRELEVLCPQIGPVFYFDELGQSNDLITMHMLAYENRGYSSTDLASRLVTDFPTDLVTDLTTEPTLYKGRFNTTILTNIKAQYRRDQSGGAGDYDIYKLIREPSRRAAMEREFQATVARKAQRHEIAQSRAVVTDTTTAIPRRDVTLDVSHEAIPVAEGQSFPDIASRVRYELERPTGDRAGSNAEISFVGIIPSEIVRRDIFSTDPVIMRVGTGDNQKEYITSRQDLARVGKKDSGQEIADQDLAVIDQLLVSRANFDFEDGRGTYNRLLREMDSIPQNQVYTAAIIRRLHPAIDLALTVDRKCIYKQVPRGSKTDLTFVFTPASLLGPQHRKDAIPEPAVISVQREWLEQTAKSSEIDDQIAARIALKRIQTENFDKPIDLK